MADFELTLMVPIRVHVDDVRTVEEAFHIAAPSLVEWSKKQNEGARTGYSIVLLDAKLKKPG